MSTQEFIPTVAGILMLVFGLSMAGAMLKGIIVNARRKKWPVVEGTVRTVSSRDGKVNSLSIVDYTAPDGSRQRTEVPTGAAGTDGKKRTIPLSIDPSNPAHAIPPPTPGTFGAMGCFGALALFFAAFGLFALVRVFTN